MPKRDKEPRGPRGAADRLFGGESGDSAVAAEGSSGSLQALVVSDLRLFREGLAEMLVRDERVGTVGVPRSVKEALVFVQSSVPDVVLLDMGMPGSQEFARTVSASPGNVKIVALGVSERRQDVVACAEAGISGYVSRESSLEDLLEAVQAAMREELRCTPKVAAALLSRVAKLAARLEREEEVDVYLTPREAEVAELLNEGLTNQQIGTRLCIEVATVKVHVHNLFDKLDVHHRGQAAAKLRKLGLLRPVGRSQVMVHEAG